VARWALAWTVGLAGTVRALSGSGADRSAPVVVALAGLLAAAVVPPVFVRGGPLETLRWTRGYLVPACLARLHGALAVALLGAAGAGVALGGGVAVSPPVVGAALLHAALVGALAAGLAPRAGCTLSTACMVLVVAAGAGAAELGGAPPVPPLVAPPGALAVRLLVGGEGRAALAGWMLLGAVGVWSAAHGAGPAASTRSGARARV
jgi:hypothetical protein